MNIQERKKTKKIYIILVFIVLALILVGLFFVYRPPAAQTNNKNNTSTKQENTFESDRKQSQDLKQNLDKKQQAPNTDKPADPTKATISDKKRVQVTASTNTSGDTIYIRGGINYPVTDGSCYAALSGPTGQTIRKDTSLLQNPVSTDCKTIAIPIGDLTPGLWKFTLNYTSNIYEGVSDEISFSV